MHALPAAEVATVAAVAAPAPTPKGEPSLFERVREVGGGRYRTFLLPGASYVGWRSIDGHETTGGGLEVSLVHWVTESWYLGAVVQAEKLDRYRVGGGVEAGYQYVGLEVSVAQEVADRSGHDRQWSLQVAPFASLGMAWVSPRWIVALSGRGQPGSPGGGGMMVFGVKIPVLLGG